MTGLPDLLCCARRAAVGPGRALGRFVAIWLMVVGFAGAADQTVGVAELRLNPEFQRVEVPSGKVTHTTVAVTTIEPLVVLAADVDCRCVSVVTPLPLTIAANQTIPITIRVSGVLPGLKRITFRTTKGTLTAGIQVATDALGQGKDILEKIVTAAKRHHGPVWFIVHDLLGAMRNCGCSQSALGGVDHLAGLSASWKREHQDIPTHFVVTGDVDGKRTGVAQTLVSFGWSTEEPRIVVATDPGEHLTRPEVTAVIVTGLTALNHRRIVRPIASGGMVALALICGPDGQIVEQIELPIDQTLERDATILSHFSDTLTQVIAADATPATACHVCHATAHAAWSRSAHARAWASLGTTDQVDDCVTCHTTPVTMPVTTQGGQRSRPTCRASPVIVVRTPTQRIRR